ncbi:hypothetical protein E2C01_054310 [Portunus trituberculatus]|uniref:Uncharacterized protein n=1 Tax=Portunus trituberculatus TaxID=210409 RepID=A0A5B7GJJ2_PORTR|nr:hypothetical protein [Portunus trituberculatus]
MWRAGLRVGQGRTAPTVLPIWFHHDRHNSRPSPQMTTLKAASPSDDLVVTAGRDGSYGEKGVVATTVTQDE